MSCRVALTPTAQRDLDRFPVTIRARTLKLFERLESWPDVSGCSRLSGRLAEFYSKRTGDYRLVFRASAAEVVVERIRHRRDVYQKRSWPDLSS